MANFIELPVLWPSDNMDMLSELGLEDKDRGEEGRVWLNTAHITSFNENDAGGTTVRDVTNGSYHIDLNISVVANILSVKLPEPTMITIEDN